MNVHSGVTEIIYRATAGACVGVITCSPQYPERYVCIHGPENPDEAWHYDLHHRRGVIIQQGLAVTLDACDITPPFTPGALRGGSHVHMYDADGDYLSFTYNDHVMHERSLAEDLRNVGVAVPLRSVSVPQRHPREYNGSHFCVLISTTTPAPVPGSDEISRAYEEGWVGHRGYRKKMVSGSGGRWYLLAIPWRRTVKRFRKSSSRICRKPPQTTHYPVLIRYREPMTGCPHRRQALSSAD